MTTLFPPGASQETKIPSSNLICHCILGPYLCLQTIFLCTWYTRLRAMESNRSESQSMLEKTQFGLWEKRVEAPPLVSRGVTVSLLECNCLSWASVRQGLPELCVLNNALIQAVAHLLVIWDGTSIRSQGRRPLVRSRGERRSRATVSYMCHAWDWRSNKKKKDEEKNWEWCILVKHSDFSSFYIETKKNKKITCVTFISIFTVH